MYWYLAEMSDGFRVIEARGCDGAAKIVLGGMVWFVRRIYRRDEHYITIYRLRGRRKRARITQLRLLRIS